MAIKFLRNQFLFAVFLAASIGVATLNAKASEADVVGVKAVQAANGWRFDVTVLHDDTGWDHYADKWEIVDENGNVLGVRVLAHPHENEQPFTRSLTGVKIPDTVKQVTVRAFDSVHKDGGKEMTVLLER